jgi:hypothetical protein
MVMADALNVEVGFRDGCGGRTRFDVPILFRAVDSHLFPSQVSTTFYLSFAYIPLA